MGTKTSVSLPPLLQWTAYRLKGLGKKIALSNLGVGVKLPKEVSPQLENELGMLREIVMKE